MKKENSIFKNFMQIMAILSLILAILFGIFDYVFINAIFYILAIVFFIISYHLGIRVILGEIIPKFKNKINPDAKRYKLTRFEEILYKKLNVKKWKDKVPTYDPDEFDFEKNTKEQLLINMCNSENVHEINIVASYAIILFAIPFGMLWLFVISAFGY